MSKFFIGDIVDYKDRKKFFKIIVYNAFLDEYKIKSLDNDDLEFWVRDEKLLNLIPTKIKFKK